MGPHRQRHLRYCIPQLFRLIRSKGAIIGTADLYDVKQYKSNSDFEKDKNKHYADIKKFGSYKFGFMVKNAHRFRTPMPYSGMLRFFEVQYPFVNA